MAAYIVTYDLMKQGQNYDCIIAKLKAYSTHWHMQQSAWIIVSSQTAIEIRNDLLNCLDANDKLFVGQLSAAAWKSAGADADNWLIAAIK